MEKKTLITYWKSNGEEFEGFADFDGERIRFCKGTVLDEGEVLEDFDEDDCMSFFSIEQVWEEIMLLCDKDGRLNLDENLIF